MSAFDKQLNKFYQGEELINKLTILPTYRYEAESIVDRYQALLDIYKIFIPTKYTIEIYNRLYLSLIEALDKKDTLDEVQRFNLNFKSAHGYKRYGVIGGLDSFKITGNAGLGKTSNIQRCSDLITSERILISSNPKREIIPILIVECVADGSFKNLLFSILKAVDSILGTNYFLANNRTTMTVDILLAETSNVLINHCCLLVIDEIERVANDSRKGETLINYLTQLVNQSNISICFVGNEVSNRYFQTREYLSRRTIGLSIKKMDYDNEFCKFVDTIFRYQYTKHQVDCTSEFTRLFYELTDGIPSMIVSLFVETQKSAIMSGDEKLTKDNIIQTFNTYFKNMNPYISRSKPLEVHKQSVSVENKNGIKTANLFHNAYQKAHGEPVTMIKLLINEIEVEYVEI